jgi:hypothetical protein
MKNIIFFIHSVHFCIYFVHYRFIYSVYSHSLKTQLLSVLIRIIIHGLIKRF